MKKLTKYIVVIIFTTLSTTTILAHISDTSEKILMPHNDRAIGVHEKANGMTEEIFNRVIDQVKEVYSPIIRKRLGVLHVQKNWKSTYVNAMARRFWPFYFVTIHGGVARHPDMTADSLALVVCHELGHLMGSYPRETIIINRWASIEGQSDYYATLKCLRQVWEKDDNKKIIRNLNTSLYVEDKCSAQFDKENNVALCIRISMAANSLASMFAEILNQNTVNFETPDQTIVPKTVKSHPDAQCRLDTYFEGALCPLPTSDYVSKHNPYKGTCTRRKGYNEGEGVRPLCWYLPE